MSSDGRYVRAPKYIDLPSSDDECEQDGSEPSRNATSSSSTYDSENDSDDNCSVDSNLATSGRSYEENNSVRNTVKTASSTPIEPGSNKTLSDTERIQKMENMLTDITKALTSRQTVRPIPDTDVNWCMPSSSSVDATLPSVRWDTFKPFPAGIPANKMWEEWNRYIENFEIASSLSNANDPIRKSQLLFFSIGDELQSIIRAAKLRPSLSDANCYNAFVANITNHFQSMTDAAAEHEAFSNMKQEKGESAIAFHARLTAKVRLCGYSPTDQDRFVRSQLLKGLRNKELVRTARTYGQDTNTIVQAATRDEAYEAEIADQPAAHRTEPYAINRIYRRQSRQLPERSRQREQPYERAPLGKRTSSDASVEASKSKRFRSNQQAPRRDLQERGRRTRCRRCDGYPHSNFPCPALNRNCNSCGERGHYAAACRKAHVRRLHADTSSSPTRDNTVDHTQVQDD